MISRRHLLRALALALTAPPLAWAQKARVRRIGFLGAGSASGFANHVSGLRAGLLEHGYEEGKNIEIAFRWAEGDSQKLPVFARDLVRLPVEVIITQGTPASRAAKEATRSVPIVIAVGDAVVTELVRNLARPEGNVTGISFFALESAVKRLELLKQALPNLRRVGLMHNPDNPIQREPLLRPLQKTAATLKIDLEVIPAKSLDEFSAAFARMSRSGVDAVMFIEDPVQISNASTLVLLATQHRLPSIGGLEFMPVGSVMGYGVDFHDIYRRSARYVARLLEGTKPAELPVEQASRFEFLVNMKSAKVLGLTISPTVLQRADRVIY